VTSPTATRTDGSEVPSRRSNAVRASAAVIECSTIDAPSPFSNAPSVSAVGAQVSHAAAIHFVEVFAAAILDAIALSVAFAAA